ncbi:MAG TPA: GNAT family N-acetyltransferase [Sphingomicrobium sp.]|jgi:ribosomal protein S18 acetylase RimI-like enzyme
MNTRDATAADLPAIDYVFRQSFCDTFAHLYAPEDLAAFLAQFTDEAWRREFEDPGYAFLVAEAHGAVVGYVKLGTSTLPVETEARAIELRQLYVLKAHHGSGLAAALTAWAIGEARRRGCEEIYLTVYTDNHRARRFYERYGFGAVGRYDFMVGSQADEDIIMRLTL